MIWSSVPKVRSGMRTLSFSSFSVWKACGVVTSWMRCRPIRSWVWPEGSVRTVCASHTLSSSVRAMKNPPPAYRAPTRAGSPAAQPASRDGYSWTDGDLLRGGEACRAGQPRASSADRAARGQRLHLHSGRRRPLPCAVGRAHRTTTRGDDRPHGLPLRRGGRPRRAGRLHARGVRAGGRSRPAQAHPGPPVRRGHGVAPVAPGRRRHPEACSRVARRTPQPFSPRRHNRRRRIMALRINSEAPNFTAETTQGKIDFHEWIGNGWAILFSHPKDFTPVCTTELGYMAGLKPQFDKRNTKIIGLSVDPVTDHERWSKDIQEAAGHAVTYPMIGDPELKVATAYDMLPEGAGTSSQGRTPADNATVRSVVIIGPDQKVKAMLTYPMSTGRNFDEVLRLLDSCQLTSKHNVATPVNWKVGEDVIIPPSVSDVQAKERFPAGWKTLKPYLRVVKQPGL